MSQSLYLVVNVNIMYKKRWQRPCVLHRWTMDWGYFGTTGQVAEFNVCIVSCSVFYFRPLISMLGCLDIYVLLVGTRSGYCSGIDFFFDSNTDGSVSSSVNLTGGQLY